MASVEQDLTVVPNQAWIDLIQFGQDDGNFYNPNNAIGSHALRMDIRPEKGSSTLLQRLSTENGGLTHFGGDFFTDDYAGPVTQKHRTRFLLDDVTPAAPGVAPHAKKGPDGVAQIFMSESQTLVMGGKFETAYYDVVKIPMYLANKGPFETAHNIIIDADKKTISTTDAAIDYTKIFRPGDFIRLTYSPTDNNSNIYWAVKNVTKHNIYCYQDLREDTASISCTKIEFGGVPIQLRDTFEKKWQPLCTNEVANPGLTQPWVVGANWTIAAGKATRTPAATTNLTQLIPDLRPSTEYQVSFTISGRTAGTLTMSIEDGTVSSDSKAGTTDGTYTAILTTHADTDPALAYLQLSPDASFDGSVDDISVKELPDYTANELVADKDFTSSWTVGANWAIASGKATHTAGATAAFEQTITTLRAGANYMCEFVVSGHSAGSVVFKITDGSANDSAVTITGDDNKLFQNEVVAHASLSSATAKIVFTPTSDFDGSIDAIYVREAPFYGALTLDPGHTNKMILTATKPCFLARWDTETNGFKCFSKGESIYLSGSANTDFHEHYYIHAVQDKVLTLTTPADNAGAVLATLTDIVISASRRTISERISEGQILKEAGVTA